MPHNSVAISSRFPNLPIDAEELLERHVELRPTLLPTDRVAPLMRSHLAPRAGAYEWWEVEARDTTGQALTLQFVNGNPFDPQYRKQAMRQLAGQTVDVMDIRGSSYPAFRCTILQDRQVKAKCDMRCPPRSFDEKFYRDDWSISYRGTDIKWSACADREQGWDICFRNCPTRPRGMKAFYRPQPEDGCHMQGSLHITPAFSTTTLLRSSMPDSPDGATHEWLIALPAARISGSITITRPEGETTIEIENWSGAVHHFWGSGIIGRGMRRWYRSSLTWGDGALHCELPILRKYIQLAGTSMLFRPDALPRIVRVDHQRTTAFQRSAWLLAHPLQADWTSEYENIALRQSVERLHDACPFAGTALTDATLTIGASPDEEIIGPAVGSFSMLQPARADWLLWKHCINH